MRYYRLTKPGIIYGNDLSAVASFIFASQLLHTFNFGLFVGFLIGLSLVIACGCVINNVIDAKIDAAMQRTRQRAIVRATIPKTHAVVFGFVLGLLGFTTLILTTNAITVALGCIGLFFYLVMYSVFKRRGPLGTIIGSVSGSTPIAAGYTSATGHFDSTALLLFVAMASWQMPHFYAIALYRFKDYRKAGIPVLTVVRGAARTIRSIYSYIVIFTLAACSLKFVAGVGYSYLVIMAIVGVLWFRTGYIKRTLASDKWGKRMFFFSLKVLLVFCLALAVAPLLP